MDTTADQLELAINEYLPKLKLLVDEKTAFKSMPGKWSKKEILGHLVDSAQNNLRRFIVGQYEENPKIVYMQDDWVRINNYQQSKLKDLVQLWYLTNLQLITVLRNSDAKEREKTCETEGSHSLNWLAADYIRHLRHHLHQVLNMDEVPYP